MLPKQQKLSSKEINYMLKKWKRIYGEVFTCWVIPQYSNNPYHQRAMQIPIKLDKRASMRNMLKRVWYQEVISIWQIWWSYYKIFVSVNKKKLAPLIEYIASHKKTAILSYRSGLVSKDIEILVKKLTHSIKTHQSQRTSKVSKKSNSQSPQKNIQQRKTVFVKRK